MEILRELHLKLVTLSPLEPTSIESGLASLLVKGQFLQLFEEEPFSSQVFQNEAVLSLTKKVVAKELDFSGYVDQLCNHIITALSADSEQTKTLVLELAVLFLQIFVENNFTGPQINFEEKSEFLGFIGLLIFDKDIEYESLSLLAISGQQSYELSQLPVLLVLSLRLLEILQKVEKSLVLKEVDISETESVVSANITPVLDLVSASSAWWRSRALQIQMSLLPESSPLLSALSLALLDTKVVRTLIGPAVQSPISQAALVSFHLEVARNSIAADCDNTTVDSLIKAKKASGFELILTGCKAKRTKFQDKAFATLTVLAKSTEDMLSLNGGSSTEGPVDIELKSDLLLEKPVYESVGDEEEDVLGNPMFESSGQLKRIKLDLSLSDMGSDLKDNSNDILPIAFNNSLIPETLKSLDPNSQPALSDMDSVQLLLRLAHIRANTPANDALVQEELTALVQRILFSPTGSTNWSVFSRALWIRSLLETSHAKTVERGVLQLYSLTEEFGMKVSTTGRLFALTDEEKNFYEKILPQGNNAVMLANSVRLRYVHQLPLMPKWEMDHQLAEKLIELGSLKSALEIYENLHMWIEAALCQASIGDEDSAEKSILRQLESHPKDARALSVLGDIRQDPELWEQSWSIGKYANAKRSLARYYYQPPKESGLSRDHAKAIGHMYDCLTASPLAYDNWYFYGVLGLEAENFQLAAEAFTRCVTIDEHNGFAWSNLATSLTRLDKYSEALVALKKAVRASERGSNSWRIWENYLLVAAKLGEWNDVLVASKELLTIKRDKQGQGSIDIPVVEKLAQILVQSTYDGEHLTSFQRNCIQYMTVSVPAVINNSARCWNVIARVELWRKRPWEALACHEKAYRAVVSSPDLAIDEKVWNEAVDACRDLAAAYESLGELPGKHDAGDLVCKDWKYKAKTTIRSLMSKGKSTWEYSDGWETLEQLKAEYM
ncbi:unnamed protein product [Kuraishia capsulata CBS 1993]|uniref:Uncharacterized protein n=1 Tax=Kuraishia capsulata CBS 1993 TaxID=1382522 RepID=W6MHI0_9ASCO|nr:uncharacterized protein KUCA_T00001115001 [Kuraishia capsulata CBS 1993]CDK25148.1 unnamed protein product [Kuraishia capsulata CBS 1993]